MFILLLRRVKRHGSSAVRLLSVAALIDNRLAEVLDFVRAVILKELVDRRQVCHVTTPALQFPGVAP